MKNYYSSKKKAGVELEKVQNDASSKGLFWFSEDKLAPANDFLGSVSKIMNAMNCRCSFPLHHTGVPPVKKVIFSGPKTIVLWADGTKTIVSCGAGDTYDYYAGFCAAVVKKLFGSMENIRANGIPMKVSHGKGYAVNYRYYTRNDQLADVELIIPKLAGDDLTGQVVTTLHEEMHLMDMFNRSDPAKYSGWFSSSHAKLSSFFQKTNTDIADDIDSLFEAFDKECKRITAEINAELRTATSTLTDQYYARTISYSDYKKAFNKLKREASEQIDYQCRNAMGGGISSLEDIYDALSGGSARDAGLVRYRKMFFYGKKCCNGVRWKQSVQNFEGHLFSGTANRRRKVLDQNWKPMKCTHFTLCERGKVRPIDAPHITDRQIHKALCNEVLTPLYGPCMIHDNGASQKGKGLHWHFRRLKEQLHWHYRRYGREGAVLLLDLKGFFPNAPHALLYQRHQELILNPNLRALADTVIQNSPCPTPGRGLPLGVEPSQQEMVALPSAIDNWIKCQAGVHCFGHYMDDYYLIFPDVEALKKLGHEVVRRFEALGIRVNKRKCKIIPLTKPFRFCKARFTLTETGKIKVNGNRDGVKRARRKLKLFHREFLEGKRLLSEVEQFMECQTAYYRNFNDHGRLLRLRRLYPD